MKLLIGCWAEPSFRSRASRPSECCAFHGSTRCAARTRRARRTYSRVASVGSSPRRPRVELGMIRRTTCIAFKFTQPDCAGEGFVSHSTPGLPFVVGLCRLYHLVRLI